MFALLLNWLKTLLQLFIKKRRKWFASFCSQDAVEYNNVAVLHKASLFQHLNEQIREFNARSDRHYHILEIGGGSGANFEFIQQPAEWTVVEPNIEFAPFFSKNRVKAEESGHKVNELVEAFGEDLGLFPDNSYDAAIMTKVLCSTPNVDKVLAEIRRVLKPRGHLYFLEHVIAPERSWLRLAQHILTASGLWPLLLDGCRLNKDIGLHMTNAAFSDVQQERYVLLEDPDILDWPNSTHLRGRAQK